MDYMKELTTDEIDLVSGGVTMAQAGEFWDRIPEKCPNPFCRNTQFRSNALLKDKTRKAIILHCIYCKKDCTISG